MLSDHILAKPSQLRNETESLTEQSRSMRDVAGIFAESEQRSRTSGRRFGGSEWMPEPYFTANEALATTACNKRGATTTCGGAPMPLPRPQITPRHIGYSFTIRLRNF